MISTKVTSLHQTTSELDPVPVAAQRWGLARLLQPLERQHFVWQLKFKFNAPVAKVPSFFVQNRFQECLSSLWKQVSGEYVERRESFHKLVF